MKKYRLIFCLSALLMLSACSGQSPEDSGVPTLEGSMPVDPSPSQEDTSTPGDEPEESPPVLPTAVPDSPADWQQNELAFTSLTYDEFFRYDEQELLHATALFPQTGIGDIDRFYEACQEDFKRIATTKADAAKSYFLEGSLDANHYINLDYAVELNSGGMLSVSRRTTSFEGGNAEMTTIVCENFSLVSGKLLWMDDIFTVDKDTYTERLLQSVYAAIDAEPDRFNADAKQDAKDFFPYESFCITTQGLSLFYSQYNIAPYTEHIVRIDVPWNAIEDIFAIPG